MAKEILAIPEHHLEDVIHVIRRGLKFTKIDDAVRENLTIWCDKEEKYLATLQEE